MLSIQTLSTTNRILSALPSKDREHLLRYCEPINLLYAEVIYLAGEPIPHVYFPTESFISLLTPNIGNKGLEVGLIGNEGMLGITLALNIDVAPFQALVQGTGAALRITASSFIRELKQSQALQQELNRYLYISMSQIAQTAICTRHHQVESRLARRLLMAHDRAHADDFYITHLYLAYILGVRRCGITKAATTLQQKNLISYRRGNIRILNRAGLEAAACSCYQTEKEAYQRILTSV